MDAEVVNQVLLLTGAQRTLVRRYLQNASSCANRRTINPGNRHFAALVHEQPGAMKLFTKAGFILEENGGALVLPEGSGAAIHGVLLAIDECSPSLLSLPDEILLLVLSRLNAPDLSAFQRTSSTAKPIASTPTLWLRFCALRFWREAGAGADRFNFEIWAVASPIGHTTSNGHLNISFQQHPEACFPGTTAHVPQAVMDRVNWQLVHRLSVLWERVRARSGHVVEASLRGGVTLEALSRVPLPFLARMPTALIASLLVHDGQDEDNGSVGFLFASARLLSLEEMRAADAESPGGGQLALSTLVGFQQLYVREQDGAVVLASGFNSHVKAKNFARFLEHLLVDTV